MKHRGLIAFFFLAIAVFAGLALYGDLPELLHQVSSFSVAYWLAVLGLALVNYLLRLVRWHYYLRVLDIRIGSGASAAIFMAGLGMAITPGRVGELAKSYFLKDKLDVSVARSSVVVIAERITDLIAVLLLSLWGLTLVPYGWVAALVVLAAFGVFILLAVTPWGSEKMLRLPVIRRWSPFLTASRDGFRQIFSIKPLTIAVVLGMLAWFAEGCGLWLVLRGLDATGSLGHAISIYAAATLLGAITLLPGGLVGTEGGMVALLQQVEGMTRTQASSATFIIRICTLWFAILIGLLALIYVQVFMPQKAAPEEIAEEVGPSPLYSDSTGEVS